MLASVSSSGDILQAMCSELDAVLEFKNLYESKCRSMLPATAYNLQQYVNAFLEEIECIVRISLLIGDKVKIQCYRGGVKLGDFKDLSKGERSMTSFALSVAFALESPVDVLIMDEITDGLRGDNKDACIETLFYITAFDKSGGEDEVKERISLLSKPMQILVSGHSKKTLAFTDHHCHYGHYDKVIDLTDKAKEGK